MSHVFFDSGQFAQIGRNTRHLMCPFLYLALTLPTAKGRGILASWQIASPPLARRSVLRLLHERSGRLRVPGSRRPCGTVSPPSGASLPPARCSEPRPARGRGAPHTQDRSCLTGRVCRPSRRPARTRSTCTQLADHFRHGGVRGGLGQPAVLLHALDVQIFDGDGLALAHRLCRGLVQGVLSLVGYPFVYAGDLHALPGVPSGTFLLPREPPLLPRELLLGLGKAPGVGDGHPVRKTLMGPLGMSGLEQSVQQMVTKYLYVGVRLTVAESTLSSSGLEMRALTIPSLGSFT